MEVRYLPEVIATEDTDWFYLQKNNGLPRKIKKSNLVPSAQQIITSATPPANPTMGIMWNELDTEGNLSQQWSYLMLQGNLAWVSPIFDFCFPVLALSQNNRISLQSKFDYFLKQVRILFRTNGASLSSTQFVDRTLTFGDPQTFIDPSNLLAYVKYSNLPQSREVSSLINVNKLVRPISETINLNLNGKGTNKYLLGFHTTASSGLSTSNYSCFESISYQLVRK